AGLARHRSPIRLGVHPAQAPIDLLLEHPAVAVKRLANLRGRHGRVRSKHGGVHRTWPKPAGARLVGHHGCGQYGPARTKRYGTVDLKGIGFADTVWTTMTAAKEAGERDKRRKAAPPGSEPPAPETPGLPERWSVHMKIYISSTYEDLIEH